MSEDLTKLNCSFGSGAILPLTTDDFIETSLSTTKTVSGGSGFTIGGACTGTMKVRLSRSGVKKLKEAGLLRRKTKIHVLSNELDSTEIIDRGIYYIGDLTVGDYETSLTCYDAMAIFDKKLSEQELSILRTNHTPVEILIEMLRYCSDSLRPLVLDNSVRSLPNANIQFKLAEDATINTARNCIEFVAILLGGFCTIEGQKLSIKRYDNTAPADSTFIDKDKVFAYTEDYYMSKITKISTSVGGFDKDLHYTEDSTKDSLTLSIYENPFLRGFVTKDDTSMPVAISNAIESAWSYLGNMEINGGTARITPEAKPELGKRIGITRFVHDSDTDKDFLANGTMLVTDYTWTHNKDISIKAVASTNDVTVSSAGLNKGGYIPYDSGGIGYDERLDEIAEEIVVTDEKIHYSGTVSDLYNTLITNGIAGDTITYDPDVDMGLILDSIELSLNIGDIEIPLGVTDTRVHQGSTPSSKYEHNYTLIGVSCSPVSGFFGYAFSSPPPFNVGVSCGTTLRAKEGFEKLPQVTSDLRYNSYNYTEHKLELSAFQYGGGADLMGLTGISVGRFADAKGCDLNSPPDFSVLEEYNSMNKRSFTLYKDEINEVIFTGGDNSLKQTIGLSWYTEGNPDFISYNDLPFFDAHLVYCIRDTKSFTDGGYNDYASMDYMINSLRFNYKVGQDKELVEPNNNSYHPAIDLAIKKVAYAIAENTNIDLTLGFKKASLMKTVSQDTFAIRPTTVNDIVKAIKSKSDKSTTNMLINSNNRLNGEIGNLISRVVYVEGRLDDVGSSGSGGNQQTNADLEAIKTDITALKTSTSELDTRLSKLESIKPQPPVDVESIKKSIEMLELRVKTLEDSGGGSTKPTGDVSVTVVQNTTQVNLGVDATDVITTDISVTKGTIPVLSLTGLLQVTQQGTFEVRVFYDGLEVPIKPKFTFIKSYQTMSFVIPLEQKTEDKQVSLRIACSSKDGLGFFEANSVVATITGAGSGKSSSYAPELSDIVTSCHVGMSTDIFGGISDTVVSDSKQVTIRNSDFTEGVNNYHISLNDKILGEITDNITTV